METLSHIQNLQQWLNSQIVGQEQLVERLCVALLADGHLLVEGAPGLAKTKAIKTLSDGLEGDFHRIQFTPDLLPGDVTGTEIYRPQEASFEFQKGPIFHNLILADEINRAPAKVQSALLEAMAERQVSIGNKTYDLPELFLVMATQNPIEQEGTYPLPEAQLDRFLMHVFVDFPDIDAERLILKLAREEASNQSFDAPEILNTSVIMQARQEVMSVHMAETVEEYVVQLVMASRNPQAYNDDALTEYLAHGVSPRATIALDRCARAYAWLQGQDFVSPSDVQAVIHNVMRHRIIPSFTAEANGVSRDQIIDKLLAQVPAV